MRSAIERHPTLFGFAVSFAIFFAAAMVLIAAELRGG